MKRKKTRSGYGWLSVVKHVKSLPLRRSDFHIGSRGREAARELWKKVPNLVKKYGLFYSDDWDAYQGVLPEERHVISDYKKDINHVERFNNTLRQRASRLVRKALSFSKSEENHYGAIKYFIAQYNLNLQSRGTTF